MSDVRTSVEGGMKRFTLKEWRECCQKLRDDYAVETDEDRRADILSVLTGIRRMIGWPSNGCM